MTTTESDRVEKLDIGNVGDGEKNLMVNQINQRLSDYQWVD